MSINPSKPRVIKDFEKMDPKLQEQIKLAYPFGFYDSLIHFHNKEGKKVSALPFETDEKYYMIRMTIAEAKAIIKDDTDFDDNGNLKEAIKDDYENKYGDLDYMSDYITDDTVESSDDDEDEDVIADEDLL